MEASRCRSAVLNWVMACARATNCMLFPVGLKNVPMDWRLERDVGYGVLTSTGHCVIP